MGAGTFRDVEATVLRTVVSRAALALAVVGGTVVGAASPAWAPKYILGASAFGECGIPGPPGFTGDFTVESFYARGDQLYAFAAVSGVCIDGLDVVGRVPGGVYPFPVAATAECVDGSAVLEVRPGAAAVEGTLGEVKDLTTFTLDLSRGTVVDRIWMTGDPPAERARLCAVERALGTRSATQVARLLNQLTLRL